MLYSFRLNDSVLNQSVLSDLVGGSVAHAAQRLGSNGMDRIVRGPESFGARISPVDPKLVVGTMPSRCGEAVPSPGNPSPLKVCHKCRYFSGNTGSTLGLHAAVQVIHTRAPTTLCVLSG